MLKLWARCKDTELSKNATAFKKPGGNNKKGHTSFCLEAWREVDKTVRKAVIKRSRKITKQFQPKRKLFKCLCDRGTEFISCLQN